MSSKIELGKRIRHHRLQRGIDQGQLANRLHVSRSAIGMWENGSNEPTLEMIKKIAEALDVPPERILFSDDELLARLDPTIVELFDDDVDALLNAAASMKLPPELLGRQNDELPENVIPMSRMPHHKIPMIGKVAAGEPILAEQEYDVYVEGPEQADAALVISGDSMAPTYLDGDTVYIKLCPSVTNGTIAVVIINDSATLKHVYQTGATLTLISDNPAYAPMVYDLREEEYVRIYGVPCGFTRMFRK